MSDLRTIAASLAEHAAALSRLSADILLLPAEPPPVDPPPVEPPPAPPPVEPPAPQPPAPEPPAPPAEPPPVVPVGTPNILAVSAEGMQPGEWRRVDTWWPGKDDGRAFKSFQAVRATPPATGSADGMGWTERLIHHEGALMAPLMRDSFAKALMLMGHDGNWRRIENPEGWSPAKGERRPFNRWFHDGEFAYFAPADAKEAMGYTTRTPLDNPGVFERYGIPIGDSQMDTVGNFAMTYADAWGRFFAYTPGGKLRSWAEGETAWTEHAAHIPKGDRNSGYAGTVLWNPVRGEVVSIGGQYFGENPDVSDRVLVVTAPDAPAVLRYATFPDGSPMKAITAGSSRFVVDPVTGDYLLLYRNGVMYRSSDCADWDVYQDLTTLKPWGAYEQYCPWDWLDDDTIVMVSHIMGVWLHRMDRGGVVSPPPPTPPAPTPPAPTPPAPTPPAPTPPHPTQPPPSGDVIAAALVGMQPGDFKQISGDTSHFSVVGASGTYSIIDWNPRMHFDATSRQLILFGLRQQHRVIAMDSTGQWRDLPLPAEWQNNPTYNGHWYGWSALDPDARRIYAKDYVFDIASETYEALPPIPERIGENVMNMNGAGGSMVAWMGDKMARYGSDRQFFVVFDPSVQQWVSATRNCGNGQHALMEYHPAHGTCLVVGGTSTGTLAQIITPEGVVTRVADFPDRLKMSSGSWIVPHVSGCWLVRSFAESGPHKLWAYRPDENEWRLIGDAPDAALTYSTAAYCPEEDAVILASTKGLHIWKARSI